ncbi:hypothetical protein EIP86_007274 [Pleurotus ostreatoroseus]|nr:hypothetical protein EIP86_007274 [Pleurotus ostreatoroseus]
MMRPHLQVFDSYTQYKTFVPDNVAIDPRPYLFCTYIKPGFLHLLTFRLTDQSDIKAYLIDSLPLALECRGVEDMKNRLRAAMALFTLQKEIVRLCEIWGMISWPAEVLADEHEAIMEVTGICSPTPSETIPEYEDGSKELLIPIPGTCLEDEPAFIAKQVAKSIEHVKPWLTQLDCVESPKYHDLEPWD